MNESISGISFFSNDGSALFLSLIFGVQTERQAGQACCRCQDQRAMCNNDLASGRGQSEDEFGDYGQVGLKGYFFILL